MNDKLLESGLEKELSFDLNSDKLNIAVSHDSSLLTLDLDEIFLVAANHMSNLIAVDFYISQNYFNMDHHYYSLNQNSKNLILSSEGLRNFLEKMSTKLESFTFGLEECCDKQFKDMTDCGNALRPLGMMPNLKKLKLSAIGFDDINVLTSCLSPKLKVLHLNRLTMGTYHDLCASDIEALVAKICPMKELASLSLEGNSPSDGDSKVLLPSLKNLRCLNVSGTFGDSQRIRYSLLTNNGLETIARYCPKIQTLEMNHQRKISSIGIRKAFNIFQELLEFEISDIQISTYEVKEFLTMSNTLLYFLFDNKVGGARDGEKHLIQDAVKATDGRTIVGSFYNGVYGVRLSQQQKRNQKLSREKVEKAWKQASDPKIYNKWDGICSGEA